MRRILSIEFLTGRLHDRNSKNVMTIIISSARTSDRVYEEAEKRRKKYDL